MIIENARSLAWPERMALALTDRLTADRNVDRIDYLKCKLALEVLFINISKMSVVYALAFVVNAALPTLIFHLAFLSIRVFAYGVHAKSSFVCTLVSSLFFVGIPWMINAEAVLAPRFVLLLWGIANVLLLMKYAPASTSKNAIGSWEKKRSLRRKAIRSNIFIIVLIIALPSLAISNLLMVGSSIAVLLILPCSYRLFESTPRKGGTER